jgi:uncharacterized pyridoxamine 5'-phosphate oxidase family protein
MQKQCKPNAKAMQKCTENGRIAHKQTNRNTKQSICKPQQKKWFKWLLLSAKIVMQAVIHGKRFVISFCFCL